MSQSQFQYNHSQSNNYPSRSRRERLLALHRNWEEQMPLLTDMYLHWKHDIPSEEPANESSSHTFIVSAVGTHGASFSTSFTQSDYFSDLQSMNITQREGEPANAALIRCGLLGTAPVHPTVAISLHTLELYHRLRRRQPRLGIQPMARALCDVHKVSTCLLSC